MSSIDSDVKLERSSTVWFDDGNVVFQAQNTQFRLHRGTLSIHSKVFRDMFSLPQPKENESGEEEVEGCPVIHLSDNKDDVEQSLKALYDRTFFRPGSEQPFHVIAPILRFSSKYLIKSLRDDALTFIIPATPPKQYADLCVWEEKFGRLVESGTPPVMVDLLRECNIPVALPMLFFIVLTLKVLYEKEGAEDTTNKRAFDRRDFLSSADDLRCATALYTLIDRYLAATHMLFANPPTETCLNGAVCPQVWKGSVKTLPQKLAELAWPALHPTNTKPPMTNHGKHFLCRSCDAAFATCYSSLCEENFQSLPKLFGVGETWTELFQQTHMDSNAAVDSV